jgi:S-adenosyl methyltransferase
VARFFEGLELVDPGIEQWHWWRPEPGDVVDTELKSGHAGVARKP